MLVLLLFCWRWARQGKGGRLGLRENPAVVGVLFSFCRGGWKGELQGEEGVLVHTEHQLEAVLIVFWVVLRGERGH